MKKERLTGFRTFKWVCCSCKKSYGTLPIMQGLDKGDECICGNTSFKNKTGRIIGKKSKQFLFWRKQYDSIKNLMPNEYLGAIYR